MDIRKLTENRRRRARGHQAKNIEVINTAKLTSLFDRIVVASGDSNRQTAARAQRAGQGQGAGDTSSASRRRDGELVLWISATTSSYHAAAIRDYYNLEELGRRREAVRLTADAAHSAE